MKFVALALVALFTQDPVADPAPRPTPEAPRAPAPAERRDPNAPTEDPAHSAPRQDPQGGAEPLRVTPPEPASPPVLAWDGTAPRTPEELDALLQRFASAWPAHVRVQLVGRSRAGGSVWRASVTRAAPEDEARLPALLCVPASGGPSDGAALSRSLAACAGLLERATHDPAVDARLARCSVQFLFAPEPSRTFPGDARPVGPALDFPVGWSGGASRPPHPLHEPETRAVADFLLQHPSIGILAYDDASTTAPFVLGGDAERRPSGGSLERFAREYLGAALATWNSSGVELASGAELGAARGLAAERLVLLLDALPRLETVEPKLERVRPDVWILEVAIANRGIVGTLEGAAASRERSSAWLDVTGADLVAVAGTRATNDAPYEPFAARANHVELGHLAGGDVLRVRLVLRGAEGAEARAAVRTLRAGSADVVVSLR